MCTRLTCPKFSLFDIHNYLARLCVVYPILNILLCTLRRTRVSSQNIGKISSYQVKLSKKRAFHHFIMYSCLYLYSQTALSIGHAITGNTRTSKSTDYFPNCTQKSAISCNDNGYNLFCHQYSGVYTVTVIIA